MHKYKTSKHLDRVLIRLQKKNKKLYENLLNKINKVINIHDIEHYKNLKHDLKKYKRVHIGNFVLTFKYDKQKDIISFTDFDHHDKIYRG